MKKQFLTFLSGVLVTLLLFALGSSALAASGTLTLEVDPVNIQVQGQLFQPKDETGADVPVFAYNGTTYAPVRALAEAYGLCVRYDETANMVTVTDRPGLNNTEVYMITDGGDVTDKSFNQGAWEGVQVWSAANGVACEYLKPTGATTDDYVASIEQAVQAGAKVVVTPGFLFEEPTYLLQDKYPGVKFILIDGNPHNADYSEYKTSGNTVGILFAEEEIGYLAGYAAVKDGKTKLGFLGGMAVPAVVRYGYGFVQGADAAAAELGMKVDVRYCYTGGFIATPEAQAMAAGWYTTGTEVIFACGGSLCYSVMAAAEASNGKVIGVDVDQSAESATVVSSAMKGLASAVEQMLDGWKADSFPGGQNLVLGAADGAIGLPMSTSRWTSFTQADYESLYAELAGGTVIPKGDTDADGKPYSDACDPTALGCSNVNVQYNSSSSAY